ncbi:MAG: NADH-quinone oxidoreductase subunit K [Microcella sp.]
MTTLQLFLYAGAFILVLGVVATMLVRDLIRRLIALNVASGGVMLLLLALADRGDGEPDPVPQALVLTGIVVMAAVTGIAIVLARRVERLDDDLEEVEP